VNGVVSLLCLCLSVSLTLSVHDERRRTLAGAHSFWAVCVCLRLPGHLSYWRMTEMAWDDMHSHHLLVSLYMVVCQILGAMVFTSHARCQIVQAWTNHASLVGTLSLSGDFCLVCVSSVTHSHRVVSSRHRVMSSKVASPAGACFSAAQKTKPYRTKTAYFSQNQT